MLGLREEDVFALVHENEVARLKSLSRLRSLNTLSTYADDWDFRPWRALSIGQYLAFRHKRRRTGSNNFLAELDNVQQKVEFRNSSAAKESASPNGRGASRYEFV